MSKIDEIYYGSEQDGYIPAYNSAGTIVDYIDAETGESVGCANYTVPFGSASFTPKQLAAMRDKKASYKKYRANGEKLKELGSFSFVSADNCFNDLSEFHIVTLIYLSTYLKYGTDELWYRRNAVKAKDLPTILDVSKRTAYGFLNAVQPEYVYADETGTLHMNEKIFHRGRGEKGKWFQRAYHDGVRRIYLQTPPKRKKHLGYIFAMLPYLNIEYNVLCKNPFEQDIDYIDFITLEEFCEIIGHDFKHVKELKSRYRSLEYENMHGVLEPFCAFVSYDGSDADNRIFVNPHIIYGGKNPDSVKILGAFCAPLNSGKAQAEETPIGA